MAVPLILSSVPNATPYAQYVSTGGQTTFPYPFPITQDSDLIVVINGVTQNTDSGYSLTGQGNTSGGNVIFTLGQTAGAIITVFRDIAIQRVSQIAQNSGYSSTVFNAEFNNIYLLLQQLAVSIGECLQVPNTNNPTPVTTLTPANYASKYLAFDMYGNPTPALLTSSGTLTPAIIGALIGPQTPAEAAASIAPTYTYYPEGDIRRYGALTSASDNSTAINAALTVSSFGGAAAYIPGGTWKTTNPCVAPSGSSMYGAGATNSVINPATGVDGLQLTSGDTTYGGRTFRDFKILGTLTGTTNNAHGVYAVAAGFILDVLFCNVAVISFNWGFFISNMEDCTIFACLVQNCWNGIYFSNQSANIFVTNNTINLVSPTTSITGSGFSIGLQMQGSPEIEGLQISGNTFYAYNYAMFFGLCFEVHINHNDISNSTVCPIYFSSTIGGLVVRDNWIELGPNASGSWNNKLSAGDGNCTGIFIAAITPSTNSKVIIAGNYITADPTVAGSTGLFLGNGNAGLIVEDNQVHNFDVCVGGGVTAASTSVTGGALTSARIRGNTLNCATNTTGTGVYSSTSATIYLNSLSSDVVVDNYVVPGTGAAATIAGSSTITVPTQATSTNQQFPVGTPVQVTATLAGGGNPIAGITYFVISSSGAAVTIGATAGGSAISWSGTGSVGSLVQAPLPINFNGSTPAGIQLFARGSFYGTLSDPAVSGQISWTANGQMITLVMTGGVLTGSAGGTTMTLAGLPGFLAPHTTQNAMCTVENNTVAVPALAQFATTGTVTFFGGLTAVAFTNAGTKGLLSTNITYTNL